MLIIKMKFNFLSKLLLCVILSSSLCDSAAITADFTRYPEVKRILGSAPGLADLFQKNGSFTREFIEQSNGKDHLDLDALIKAISLDLASDPEFASLKFGLRDRMNGFYTKSMNEIDYLDSLQLEHSERLALYERVIGYPEAIDVLRVEIKLAPVFLKETSAAIRYLNQTSDTPHFSPEELIKNIAYDIANDASLLKLRKYLSPNLFYNRNGLTTDAGSSARLRNFTFDSMIARYEAHKSIKDGEHFSRLQEAFPEVKRILGLKMEFSLIFRKRTSFSSKILADNPEVSPFELARAMAKDIALDSAFSLLKDDIMADRGAVLYVDVNKGLTTEMTQRPFKQLIHEYETEDLANILHDSYLNAQWVSRIVPAAQQQQVQAQDQE